MIKNISLIIMLLLLLPTLGLESTTTCKANDSLLAKSYKDIAKEVDENWKDSTLIVKLAKAWIQKAKKDHNYKQLALAYRAMFHKSGKNQRLLFADSIISASKSTSDASTIGAAYLTKGVAYYEGMESSKALDQYLIADRYISQIQDKYLIHKTKYLIAQTKYYLGFYHEAIALFRKCVEYYKEEDDLAYLNALHGLCLCYYSVGQYEWCSETVKKGIAAGKEFEYTEMEMYFLHAEGVNQYFKRNYGKSMALLSKVMPELQKKKDHANAVISFFT